MQRTRLLAAPVAALVLARLASAASLGPTTTTRLHGYTGTGASGVPTVLASDHFTTAAVGSLAGRPLVIGQAWTVAVGTWLLTGSQVEINGVALGRAITPTGQPDARIVLTVADTGQGGRTSGVVFRSDPTATTFLSAFTQNGSGGRIYLAKREGGVSTTLVTASGVPFTNPAVFVVELDGPTVKIAYNNVVYITHSLTAAEQAVFGVLGGHGMLNDNAATVRYDDFRVETLR